MKCRDALLSIAMADCTALDINAMTFIVLCNNFALELLLQGG